MSQDRGRRAGNGRPGPDGELPLDSYPNGARAGQVPRARVPARAVGKGKILPSRRSKQSNRISNQ